MPDNRQPLTPETPTAQWREGFMVRGPRSGILRLARPAPPPRDPAAYLRTLLDEPRLTAARPTRFSSPPRL
ncbi:MAG: hypothetical protein LBS11_12485 [Oscillospiraceae bacterium]|nr:hypothetical protein [Oscillospiraceae bacterium]